LPGEVYKLTPREWDNYIKGKDKHRQHDLEYNRMFFSILVNCQLTKTIQPRELYPFHWDGDYISTSTFNKELRQKIKEATAKW